MTESTDTKKFHPSPAKNEKQSTATSQTDGSNRHLAETAGSEPDMNVIEEQKKTERGYEDLKKKIQ
ncbi:MAG: hypothetical protein H7222_17425 [Methylotenera sp.]|nr:hypothetical protein [Oligoflexia bacterium]